MPLPRSYKCQKTAVRDSHVVWRRGYQVPYIRKLEKIAGIPNPKPTTTAQANWCLHEYPCRVAAENDPMPQSNMANTDARKAPQAKLLGSVSQ